MIGSNSLQTRSSIVLAECSDGRVGIWATRKEEESNEPNAIMVVAGVFFPEKEDEEL